MNRFLTCLAALTALVVAPMASACEVRRTALDEYLMLVEEGTPFVVVEGRLAPEPGANFVLLANLDYRLAARLTGRSLSPKGFTEPYDEPVAYFNRIEDVLPDTAGIAFVRLNTRGPVVSVDFCGGGFVAASEAEITALIRCHQGGSCEEPR